MSNRCNNCGWDNLDSATTCEKCGCTLNPNNAKHFNRQTVSEASAFGNSRPSSDAPNCPKCGYPVSSSMSVCPQCGTPLNAVKPKCPRCGQPVEPGSKFCRECGTTLQDHPSPRPAMATVMGGPVMPMGQMGARFCTLRPVPYQGEEVSYEPITYSGDEIALSRANTDANNSSITSKEQAVLIHEADGWYIENRSELQSTYIRLSSHKVKIESGDHIILGNREFEFKG